MPNASILNLFGRSPIRPMEEHMAKVHACVKHLDPFFSAVLRQNWTEAEEQQKIITGLEHEADEMKRELRLHLPKGLFMPVSRSDLLELINAQDRLANLARDIAGIVFGRKMVLPEQLGKPFMIFLQRCIEASKQANIAIHELDELLETGFSGPEIRIVDGMIAKLAQIEHETDEQQVQLRQIMFGLENSLSPIQAIFFYKMIEWTGKLANQAQDVGDRLQILLAR